MLFGTGSDAATYFVFHFSVGTKRMHQESRYSPGVPESLEVPHVSPVLSRGQQWSVSIREESDGIGLWYVKCRKERTT